MLYCQIGVQLDNKRYLGLENWLGRLNFGNFDISSSRYDESRGRYAYIETIEGQCLPYFFSPTCPKTKFRENKIS